MKLIHLLVTSSAIVLLGSCSQDQTATKQAESSETAVYAPDENRKFPERVLWGDQHVHTGWSADAGASGTRLTPEDAVRFAMGEQITSTTGVKVQMRKPFDWIAVTDHSDGMGTINELLDGNQEFLADKMSKHWYDMIKTGGENQTKAMREIIAAQADGTLPKIFNDPKWAKSAWEKTVDIMEKYNKPGSFTAFISYEWSSNGEVGQNLHRNVIFRDGADKTRATLPLTTYESAAPGRTGPDPESLWAWLANWEAKTGGKALAIPHNGNLSNGWMFREARYDGSPMTREWAEARQRWEPLFEVWQIKGASEQHPSLNRKDEFADFEIWDTADLTGHPKPPGAFSAEYWREALKNGIKIQNSALGVNPFRYGAAGGSDTHTALPTGGEKENNFAGKFTTSEPSAHRWDHFYAKEGSYVRKDWTLSAQGAMGVWAMANTREAIWDAMMRRETYASSGPRMTLRFFGGYDYADADAKGDLAANGYSKGVPMGGSLKAAGAGKVPTFLFAAMKDPDGANLDRIQIVKGWVDAQGKTHEKVYDVKWSGERKPGADGRVPAVGNTVNLKDATYTNSIGAASFVGVFRDPAFNPKERAFYYARVIEIPTPRWTLYDSIKYKVKMTPNVTMTLQERAVCSPIWYDPA